MLCVSTNVYVCVLQGCLAEPETQLLALIDFSDREDFPVQGNTPLNRLRSLLAGNGSPHLRGQMESFNACVDALAGRSDSGSRGSGWQDHRCQSLRKEEEPNCRRHPPDPMELAAAHNFPLSWLRGVHHSYETLAGSTSERLSFSLLWG